MSHSLHHAFTTMESAQRATSRQPKGRSQVHGSGRSLRPQKGSGRARLGDRGSPAIKGGGRAFGSGQAPRVVAQKALPAQLRGAWEGWQTTQAPLVEKALPVAPFFAKTADLARWLASQGATGGLLVIALERQDLARAAANLRDFKIVVGRPSLPAVLRAEKGVWTLS